MKINSIFFSAAAFVAYIGTAHAGLGEPGHEQVVEKKTYEIDKSKIEHPQMQNHHQGHLDSSLTDHMTEAEILEEFRKADKNHDGHVTEREFIVFMEEDHPPEELEDDAPEGERQKIADTHRETELQLFHDIDRNNDKKISFKEFQIHIHQSWEEHKEEYHRQIHQELWVNYKLNT